jgi:hypothetical protein
MKYLTDSEILKWNEKLEKVKSTGQTGHFVVIPRYHAKHSEPLIHFQWKSSNLQFEEIKSIPEPSIKYQFSFSVASNRTSNFFDIFDTLIKDGFATKSIMIDNNNSEKISDISFFNSIVESKTEIKHLVGKKEYVRFSYQFSGKLGSIMAYVTYLEDTINFFSMMWGYNKDGHEINLIKFPIGSIVSPIKDKSRDYIIVDYRMSKIGGDYKIYLVGSEIVDTTGSIIKYGDIFKFSESDLTFSRTNRIDDILN